MPTASEQISIQVPNDLVNKFREPSGPLWIILKILLGVLMIFMFVTIFLMAYSSSVVYKIIKNPKYYKDRLDQSILDHTTLLIILIVIVKISVTMQFSAGVAILRKGQVLLVPRLAFMSIINIIISIVTLIVISPKLLSVMSLGFQVSILILSAFMTYMIVNGNLKNNHVNQKNIQSESKKISLLFA